VAEGAWREFVARAAPNLRPVSDSTGEEVVFAAVIDGVRYTLCRRSLSYPTRPLRLSPREREIASMVAKGYTNKTIAAVLDISLWTVDTYLRRIYRKLDVRSRSAMVGRLASDGVVDTRHTPDWSEAWRAHVADR
jgi:DNA-binding CsgD family transcriptional regulator